MMLSVAGAVPAQSLYSNQSSNVNVAALNAMATSRSGVAAPSGGRWSEVQANGAGPQAESNTNAGYSGQLSGAGPNFRLADDFTVTGGGWNISGIKVYGYQTGSVSNFISGGSLFIRSAAPNGTNNLLATATYGGNTTTIQWDASGASGNLYRIFNSNSPPPGTTPGTTRQIREITFNISSLTLAAGTYWIDYQITLASGTTGFFPATTHQDMRGVSGANALQLTTAGWIQAMDTGNPASAADVAQELPFKVMGTPVPEPASMTALGLGAAYLLRRRRSKAA